MNNCKLSIRLEQITSRLDKRLVVINLLLLTIGILNLIRILKDLIAL